jgi:hypothetical protein
MNEPKRRGRPPKLLQPTEPNAKAEGAECVDCGQAVGHYDDCPVGMGVLPVSAAQAYAMRVWEGQSVSLPRKERIERVKRALEGQNLPFEGVELP